MRATLNDCLRFLIGCALRVAGAVAEVIHRGRALNHTRVHARLGRRFGIRPETELTSSVPAAAPVPRRPGHGAALVAHTSGTSGDPKVVRYTRGRIASVRWVFIDSFLRMFWMLGVRRTGLYVFGPTREDGSLSGILLREQGRPSYLATLQAPYRIHSWEPLRRLEESYGTASVRVWVLALANPGVLYATNPSTLSAFFDELQAEWASANALVRDWVRDSKAFPAPVRAAMSRIASRGHATRLARIAMSPTYLPIAEWAPAVRLYVCWTGGYVQPFLDRLETHLPPSRVRRVPMYSMSTETIETIPEFRRGQCSFLPIPPGVYCEFLDVAYPREAARLLDPWQLRVGSAYELVVSDGHGLRRYCTDDTFLVERHVAGLPSLRFLRRRGLAYSFTGEKLTGAQASLAFERLRGKFPGLSLDHALTCFPSRRPREDLPHYRLVLVYPGCSDPGPVPGLAERFDSLLCELNLEYRAKRASGRLGNVRLERLGLRELRRRLPEGSAAGLDSQFKFLPLYPRLWEDAGAERAELDLREGR